MKRYPAFDPPEYVEWEPDSSLLEEFRSRIGADPDRAVAINRLSSEDKLELYRRLLRARLHDIGLKRWVRQGVISKAWLGTGEEAATTGPVFALDPGRDYVCPMIRNASACCDMGMSLPDMFRGYLATDNSPSRGRDVHIGDMDKHVLPPISPVGVVVPVMMGLALSARIRGEKLVAMTWIGDGTANAGVTHEGLNFAAVRKVPAIFIIQNNQVALGTRLDQHHRAPGFGDWPAAYGMTGLSFDGNNVLDAYGAAAIAVEKCLLGEGPVLLLAETFRMGGHATHDEREARETFSAELFREWGRRDPIGMFEEYLKAEEVSPDALKAVEDEVTAMVERAAEEALKDRDRLPVPESALEDVYA